MNIKPHSIETAPDASKPILKKTREQFGFDLNLFGVMAESPLALSAYTTLSGLVEKHAALSPQEQQIVMLAVSARGGCAYCMAAHSTVAGMVGLDEEVVKTLREQGEPSDPKTAALVRFARQLVDERGWVPEEDQQAFLDAGYEKRHLLDVVAILALKTLSNTTNHLAETPLDEQFEANKWSKSS